MSNNRKNNVILCSKPAHVGTGERFRTIMVLLFYIIMAPILFLPGTSVCPYVTLHFRSISGEPCYLGSPNLLRRLVMRCRRSLLFLGSVVKGQGCSGPQFKNHFRSISQERFDLGSPNLLRWMVMMCRGSYCFLGQWVKGQGRSGYISIPFAYY